jgi:hypothetical protein
MKANDRDDFHKAMSVELKAHINQRHWVKMPHMVLPKDMKPIKTVWSFKHKHRPNRSLLKHKACLCIHGGMQEKGVNFWETYSPFVTPADAIHPGRLVGMADQFHSCIPVSGRQNQKNLP